VVQFDFDENGILKVDAYEEKSMNKGSITVTTFKGRLSEEQV
jgi:molecular chaperone DnaK (HSP70)